MLPSFLQRLGICGLLGVVCVGAGFAQTAGAGAVLPLTEAERAWLREHPVIRVGFDPDFKPFCFRGQDGALHGIDADLLAWLGPRLGVRFETRSADTWTQVYSAALRRDVDMLSSIADLPERREHFAFSREYVRFPVTIVVQTDGPFAVTDSDLQTMRVAVARNYAATLAFARAYPGARTVECDTIEEAMALVTRGKADAAVTNLVNASYIIKTTGLANLKIAGVLPEVFDLRLAVRRDWPELRGILDKALAALPPEEMAAILDRWVKVDYASVIRWDVVRRWAIVGAVFTLTIVGLVSWRNRCLRAELAKRLVVQQELEAANVRLNLANAELTQRHDEKDELMRVAAHDLRGPLTAILLNGDLARGSPGCPAELDTIAAAARQMTQLVDDLLDVHALEEGRRVFREEAVDVAALVRASAAALEAVGRRKAITIDATAVQRVPAVQADPGALRQVIDNLLSNAIKFSPAGSRVELSTAEWRDFVRIELRDRGPGVAVEERERIFTKYARGSAQPTGGEKSTGLGLAIVRDLVAVMNGRVWCESAPGGGAVFIVVLPRIAGAG